MKFLLASICFIIVSMSILEEARSEPIRVRMISSVEKVQISGSRLRVQNLSSPFRPISIPSDSYLEARLQVKDGKRFWLVRLNKADIEHIFSDQYLLIQGENLRVGSQQLPSKVMLSSATTGTLDVIGVLNLEAYLVGVLASEMPLSWPLETLKAQAIAARSYALAVMAERKDKPYHLESSILDQVFRHIVSEDVHDPATGKALQAVRETKDEKLYGPNQRVLKAFFHSDCGGQTTTAKDVWNFGVNAGVATDHSCPTNPRAHWKLTLTKAELERKLQVQNISKLELVRRASEKRVQAVRIAYEGTLSKVISANSFRQMLGYGDLRSSFFEFKKVGEVYSFQGQGFGHGVGLCQWGSRMLGQSGMSYRKILAHYYPLAQIK